MNGKDLMQALNDIDERYIEEALPWSAAVKKERHPVWALAAGLALCLGLGAGAALLFGGPLLTSGDPGPEVTTLENAATGEARAAEQEAPEVPIPDLEFAVNDTGIGRATGGVYAAGEGTQRELTLDELSSLREQPGLSWMGGYYLTGTALFDENGGTLQVMVAGYDPSIVDESLETFPVTESPAFTLVLGKEGESGLPNAIEDQLFFLEEPNNTVEGVGVRAARSEEEGVYIDPVSGESRSAQVTLYCTGCTLDGASVGLMAIADGTALTEEEAQRLAEVAAGYGVHYGLSLEGLSAEPKGKDAPNVNYGDSYHLTVLGPLGSRAPLDFAAYTVETQEEYGSYEEFLQAMEEDFNLGRWPEGFAEGSTNRELTQEEMQSIWGGQLPWQENLPLAGWAVFDPSGDLEGVYLYGADEGSQEIGSRFLVVLRPGPLDWEALRRRELSYDIIQKPNNQVNGQDVYAVTTALDQFYEDDAGERVDLGDHITYQASFQTDSLAVTVYGYAQGAAGDAPTPEEQQAEALARDAAQALVETVVGRSLYGPLSLEGIAGGADSAPQEESTSSQAESAVSSEIESQIDGSAVRQEPAASPTVDLSFTSRPEGDSTFSDVWNTFTELYLEPQDLAPHGAKSDYTLSEEELASIWGGVVPWRDMLTENDEVLAYGYFSGGGELIKVFVGGYRDDPDTTNHEMFQLFAVSLYNMEPTGTWGQDVEEVLALAGATVNNMDVATQQIFSPVEYEDGSTMDHTAYSAAFQPTAGPAFMVVDAFASQVSFSEEEAKGFVEQVTGGSLYNGVNLDAIAKGE